MAPRLELQALLEAMVPNVYFQQPPSVGMNYPCIIYRRDNILANYADNGRYKHTKLYQVTVIDKNPDSDIPDELAKLPLCSFDRHFTADNLNHDVYNLYF